MATPATDKEGFLTNLADWSEPTAEWLAQQEGIALTDEHWELLWLVRRFYEQYKLSPAMRPLVKYARQELGDDKGKSMYLLKLFPDSPAKRIAKIAGLPKPDNCL